MVGRKLEELEPKIVWKLFESITQIPRPSKKEQKIRTWIKSWAENHKITYKEDEIGNLLLQNPAAVGCETWPTLVLQAHMDMVCQKEPTSSINFEIDPIPVKIVNNRVMAEGTTLGADNGVGMAMALATLIEPLKSGPIEVLLTVDEETGLTGAFQMQKGFFSGNKVLNLDSEELGVIYIGSAGGGGITLQLDKITHQVPTSWSTVKITVGGLQGGHSGVDIAKQRENAIKILNSYLKQLSKSVECRICEFTGGTAHNAIPRDASCTLSIPTTRLAALQQDFNGWKTNLADQINDHEPKLKIEFEKTEHASHVTSEITETLIELIDQIPHGVISWSEEMENLVQTSNNLATITFDEHISIYCSTRSSVDSELDRVRDEIKELATDLGVNTKLEGTYPGWTPEPKAEFTQYIKNIYEEFSDSEVELKAIHAGLECGLFKRLNPNLEIASIGPEIHNPHSPSEYVEISSVEKLWKILIAILERSNRLS